MTYRCLKTQKFVNNEYSFVPIRQEDIEKIRQWRNAQIPILRQNTPILAVEQQRYYTHAIAPTFNQQKPEQVLFSFLENGTCIGYGGLTHIDWDNKRGEVSFLLNPDYAKHDQAFLNFITFLKAIAFSKSELNLHRIFTETYSTRSILLPLLEKSGFQYEGRLRDQVFKAGSWCDSVIHGLINDQNR